MMNTFIKTKNENLYIYLYNVSYKFVDIEFSYPDTYLPVSWPARGVFH